MFHCDTSQAIGKIPVDVHDLGVDFACVAGHKLYAPKVRTMQTLSSPAVVVAPLSTSGRLQRPRFLFFFLFLFD